MRRFAIGLVLGGLIGLGAGWVGAYTAGHGASYRREVWLPRWAAVAGTCRDVRQEVLRREAQGPVGYRTAQECVVARGAWLDPYTGRTVTNPRHLDIDHVVPLSEAHRSGGWRWPVEQRQRYANDLGYRFHLLAVDAGQNRAKGDQTPTTWRPVNAGFWCRYGEMWSTIKFTWDLEASDAERQAVRQMVETC